DPCGAVRVRELWARRVLEQHEHADPRVRLLLRMHVDDRYLLLPHLHPVVRPRVRDPDLSLAEGLPEIGLRRPAHAGKVLLALEEADRTAELARRLVPRVLRLQVEPGD